MLGSDGSPLNGSADADFLLARSAGIIEGSGGNDIILGDIGEFYLEGSNAGFASALDLDHFDTAWSIDENPLVAGDTFTPHTTVYVAADPGREFFELFIAEGQTITIDIDGGGGTLGGADDGDTIVDLFHEGDLVNSVAGNDDSAVADGGYGSVQGPTVGISRDSFLTFTALTDGIYYLRVGQSDGGDNNFDGGEEFLLNVSLTGHVTGAAAAHNADFIIGGAGNDQLFGAGANDSIRGDAGEDLILGGSGIDALYGEAGNDVIAGGDGDDFIRGGAGADMLDGATGGGDTLDYSDSTMGVYVRLVDNLVAWGDADGDVIAGFEYVHGSAAGNDTLVGDAGGNLLQGLGGNDYLLGGGGSDSLSGGEGIDTLGYYNSPAGVTVNLATNSVSGGEAAGDIIAAFEDVVGSAHADLLTGDDNANDLAGFDGNDTLNGGGGNDTLTGGPGNDFFYVDSAGDLVVEASGGGSDRIFAGASYIQGAGVHVELLTTSNNAGTAAINLTGNELGNTIYGNAGTNVLNGGAGADTLAGLAGNDTLISGTGIDTLVGGLGDDNYYVDSAGDVVVEGVSGGTGDRIFASVSFTLAAGVEVERLTTDSNAGTAAINLTGSSVANLIYGNAGANILDGRGGADTLVGLGGNDSYYVDNAADTVTEAVGEGTDRIFASVSYTQGTGVHAELLTTNSNAATAAINLTGNALANTIYGNDSYYVDNAADTVTEAVGEGTDRIFASVSYTQGAGVHAELLTTNSNAATAAINLTGNALANTIYGNAGANTLDGKAGTDTLVGLAGADTFAFTTALGAGNVDTISAFSVADDTISLENAVFTGLAAGALAAGAFNTGAAATQADDRVIYNSATGALLFDADGVGGGAAVQFASLSAGLTLGAGDFMIV